MAERLAVKDVVHLTGLDHATVRRLRLLEVDEACGTECAKGAGVTNAGGAGVELV